MLELLIPSKTRRKILELFFQHQDQSIYLRKVVREVQEEVNAVKRELDILVKAKVLKKEKRLNKVFYFLNKNYIFYEEFIKIFTKRTFLAKSLYQNLAKLGKLKFIALSTKFLKKMPINENEVYLLIIGAVVLPEINAIIREAEKDFGSEINYTVMTEEEFNFRKKNNDPFIWRFLKQPKTMILGNEEDLLK